MKIRPVCSAVVSVGTFLLLLAGARSTQAAQIKIVSASAYEDTEGPSRSNPDFPAAARHQGIAHRSEFDALPVGGALLTEIRFRPDGAVPVGEVFSFGRVQWSLSVTQVDPLDISFTFAANITGMPVEVYNAAWSSPVINPDPPGAETRPFDLRFPLETPYFYNPAEGNLLMDIIYEMPGPGVNNLARLDLDQSNAFSEKRDIWSGPFGVNSPMSFAGTFTSINEYVFIPVTPGDYNRDGVVDGGDLANWTAGFGTTGNATPTQGDADGDNDVDGADLLVWQRQQGSGPNSTGAAIPEPTALVILVTGVLAIFSRRSETPPSPALLRVGLAAVSTI